MQRMRVKQFQSFLIVLTSLIGLAQILPVQAADKGLTNDVGFSVAAKLPKNQIDPQHSFFDLKMTAGKTQRLQAVVYNATNRDIQIQTAVHTAYTNSNGIIEYITPAKTFDPSLKYRMADLIKIQGNTTITVPAGGSKMVTATVKMPKQPINGVILGGWYFKRLDQKVTGRVKGTMAVTNHYSYVIGTKLTEGQVPAPHLILDKVQGGMSNYHRGIFPYLRNVSAVIVPDLVTATTITEKSSGRVVKTAKQRNVQLAPNSVYRYPILTGETPIKAGKYHLHMTVKNSQHQWRFDKDFIISPQAANKVNNQSVDDAGIRPVWLVVFGALGMLVLGLVGVWIWLFIRKRRQG